ncbi:MAG: ribbon-helix-helix protein, CopG family [Fimbriimonas sp.]
MKNVTISLPDNVLEELRQEAKAEDKSLNAWLREVLSAHASRNTGWFDDLLATVDRVAAIEPAGQAEPWTWNREDIYRERLDRYKGGK